MSLVPAWGRAFLQEIGLHFIDLAGDRSSENDGGSHTLPWTSKIYMTLILHLILISGHGRWTAAGDQGCERGMLLDLLFVPLPKVATLFLLFVSSCLFNSLLSCWGQAAGSGWLARPGSDPNSGDIILKTCHQQQGPAYPCAEEVH